VSDADALRLAARRFLVVVLLDAGVGVVNRIDRGIDMTIREDRSNATAEGRAEYAAEDPTLAQWLAKAERRREIPWLA
jgi:hypothetical protein